MSKLKKSILIIGILVVAVAASLGTALALYATGSMKTDPIELVYVLRGKEKVYDGTPLTLDDPLNDISLQKGKLAEGHIAKYEFIGSQTNVGTTISDMTVKIYDKDGFNVSGDYSIKVTGAPLTVTQKSISVDMPSQKVVYNGSKVLFSKYEITEDSEGDLCSGHKIYGSTDAELLNVGDTLPDDLTPLVFDVAGNDVTANYSIEFTMGEIEVIPRYISVRPVTYEKVYDGTELIADQIEFLEGTLVEGQIARFKINEDYENKICDAGTVETGITEIKIFDISGGEEVDVTENYEIDTYETGFLKVTPRLLTVTAKSAEFVYNGTEQSLTDDGEALFVEGLADGEELVSVSYSGALTDVGTTENTIIGVILTGNEDNYEKHFIDGKITVLPFDLEIKTGSAEKYYDGEPLTEGALDITLAHEKHRILINGDGELPSLTDAGQILNDYEIAVLDGANNECTRNYALKYVYGTLTVKKLPVKITLNDKEHVEYDGEIHTPYFGSLEAGNSQYFKVEPVLGENEEVGVFNLDYSHFEAVPDAREMRNAGEYRYTVKFKDKKLYDNYVPEIPEFGYLTIDRKAFTYETGTLSKPYSGKALTDPSYSLTGEIVSGHTIAGPLTYPSIINAGEIFNEYSITVKDANGVDATANYSVSYTYGKLTVEKLPLSVELKKYEDADAFTYSGKAVSINVNDAIVAITTTAQGVTVADVIDSGDFTVVCDGEIIDAGDVYSYTVKITEKEFAKNFALTVKGNTAKVVVKALPVTVTLKDVERTYNGAEHIIDAYSSVHAISNTKTGLTRDDLEISYDDPSAEHINATNYPFTVNVCDAKKKNYVLTVNNLNDLSRNKALLKILKFEVNVTTDTQVFQYNGEEQFSGVFVNGALANSSHKIAVATLPADMPKVCNVGEEAENIFDLAITDEAGNSVGANYAINLIAGKLSIKPCPITITTGSSERAFNGEALTDSEASANITLFRNHEIVVPSEEDLPSLTYVGTLKNEFECDIQTANGEPIRDNYLITYVYGTLRVTKLSVTLKTGDADKIYDGRPLSAATAEILDLPDEMSLNYNARPSEGSTEFSITDVGTHENRFVCAVYSNDDTDVTENFEISYVYGTLKITPLAATVYLNDFSDRDLYNMEYDGTAKTFNVSDAIEYILVNGKQYVLDGGIIDEGIYYGQTDEDDEDGISFSAADFEIVYKTLILDAGNYTYSVKFTNEKFAANFILEQVQPTVRVTKKQITLNLKSFTEGDSLTFGGGVQTLSPEEAVIDILDNQLQPVPSDLISAKDFTVIYPTELRNAGNYKYKVRITYDYKAKNFNFTEKEGDVTIDKLNVTLTLNDIVYEYSGGEYAVSAADAVTLRGTNLLNSSDFVISVTGGEKLINAGTYAYTAELADKAYAANFVFATEEGEIPEGTVEITPMEIAVMLNDLNYTYCAEIIKIDGAKALEISSPLVKPEDFTFAVFSDGAEAELLKSGEYSYTVTLNNGNFTVAGSTDGVVDGGTVTVNKLSVTVTLNNFAKEYDGSEYVIVPETAIYAVSGTTFGKYDFSVSYGDGEADHSAAGEYFVNVALADVHADKLDDVEINAVNGKISISKKTVTVTTQTKSFVYDGKEHSAAEPVLSGALYGHRAQVILDTVVSVKDVLAEPASNNCEYTIVYTYTDGDGNETEMDVTENYNILYNYGTLSVTRRPLKVTTGTSVKAYDGAELSDATLSFEGLAEGHQIFAAEDLPNLINVGKVENAYICKIMEGLRNVTDNYEISYVYGNLEITAAEVTVTLKNVTLTYTGRDAALTSDDFIDVIASDAAFDGSEFAVVIDGEAVNAGEYFFTVKFKSEEEASNYSLKIAGSNVLTIKKANITVKLQNALGKKYSGVAQTATVADVLSVSANPDGLTAADLTFVYQVEMLNVGDYTYGVRITDRTLSGNYEVATEGGNYQIVPAEVSVTLKNYAVTYNNANHVINVFDAVKLLEGDGAALLSKNDFAVVYTDDLHLANDCLEPLKAGEIYDGETRVIGTTTYKVITKSVYTYGIELKDLAKSVNFDITIKEGGEFKINKRKLTITFANLEMSRQDFDEGYNGDYEESFDVTYNISVSNLTPLADGDSFVITSAIAEGDGIGNLELYSIAEYTLSNEGCYEFTNLDGVNPVTAKLKIY